MFGSILICLELLKPQFKIVKKTYSTRKKKSPEIKIQRMNLNNVN